MRTEFKIFLTIWIIYVLFLSDYGGNYMAESMLDATIALVDNGNFEIDDYVREECKITGCDHSFYNGKIYSGYAPGGSMIAVPLYAVAKPFLELFLPESFNGYSKTRLKIIVFNALAGVFITAVLSACIAVLIYKLLEHMSFSKKSCLWVTFLFAFGTLFFTYSTAYFNRVNVSFFLFLSFYLLYLMKIGKMKKTKSSLFLLGILSSSAITIEYSTVLVVSLLFLYLISFFRNKKIIYYILGSIIPLLLLMSYHYAIYDNPISSSYQYHKNINGQDAVAENELKIPDFEHLWGVSFSPEKGYFFFIPFMFVSVLGLFKGLKEKKFMSELLLIMSIFIVMFIFNASLSESWKGNCAFGPRYLLVTIPFMIIPSIFLIKNLFVKILGILSVFINSLPVLYLRTNGCDLPNSIFQRYLPTLFEKGLSNYTLNLIDLKLFKISLLYQNLIMIVSLTIIGLIIYFIWKK
ncbi:MAG: phospholipid carrier-dependent glycosyltransferase [Nanoarchaeota archaeon]|nr:phospholipid carrier-dependent glycosyltransferase [Nanoarchaeota archaeon]